MGDCCGISKEQLHAWADGEAGELSDKIAQHVATCEVCAQEVEVATRTGKILRHMVNQGVGPVEPLVALQGIRHRIEHNEQRAPMARLLAWWDDLWAFNRRAVVGVAMAVALGALVAPGVVWLADSQTSDRMPAELGSDPTMASVVVESVEIEGNAKTVVYQPQGSSTAVIWIDTRESY